MAPLLWGHLFLASVSFEDVASVQKSVISFLARFGLLILAQGKWRGKALLENSNYLSEALQPSQNLRRSYGLLWWRIELGDIVAALGKLSRAVLIVPDKQIVIVRIGDRPKDNERDFRHKFWKLISAVMPND